LEYKLLGVGIPSRYLEYLLMVKVAVKKELGKIGIDKFRVGLDQFEMELTKWN